MAGYSVSMTITSNGGATTYTQTLDGDDTPGNYTPAYGLADPLTITQKLTDDAHGILAHPEPDEATVTLIAQNSSTYAALALGDPIALAVYPQKALAGTPVTFYGRVAAIAGEPHPLGVQLTLSCVDYTADLAEIPVGDAAYPVENASQRVTRIAADAGIPTPTVYPAGFGGIGGRIMAARSAGRSDAYTLLRECLDSASFRVWKDMDGNNLPVTSGSPTPHVVSYRPYIVPNITAGQLDPTVPFSVRIGTPWGRRVLYAPPARLVNVSGTYTVQVDAANSSPSTGAPIISARRVRFAPAFAQSKAGGLPNVTTAVDAAGTRYTWDWRYTDTWVVGGAVFGPGGYTPYFTSSALGASPPVVQELDTILDSTDSGGTGASVAVQDYRVPFRPSAGSDWNVGTLEWELWAEPTAWRRPELTELLTVAGAAAAKLPNAREWVTGLVSGTRLSIARGRPTLELDLAPVSLDYWANREQLGSSLGVASLDSPVLSGVTLAQLSARDTLADYMIVRGS